MRFYRKFLCFFVSLVLALSFSYPPSVIKTEASSGSFAEDFKSILHKDNTATTANWDTIAGKVLLNEGPFSFNLNSTDNLPEDTKVATLKFNGSYWLIGGYTGISETIAPVLYSYSGPYDGSGTWTNLTSNISGMDVVSALGWNGTYWLIGGVAVGVSTDTVLYSYDDSPATWIDLSSNIFDLDGGTGLDAFLNITWNGTFWMLGGMPVWGNAYLYSYDGGADGLGFWTNLSSHVPDINPLNDDVMIFSTAWDDTDDYWMVGGLAFRDDPGDPGPVLLSYSGGSDDSGTWVDLSSNIFNSVDGTGLFAVLSIGWNNIDNYWLIGGFAIDDSDLYSYTGGANGSGTWTPINISLPFFSFISGIGWNEEYWIIGGGNFLILEAMSLPGMEVLSKSVKSMTAVENPPDEDLDIALYYYDGDASGNGTWLDFSGSVQDIVISTINYDTGNDYWLLGGFNFFLDFSSPALYSLVIGGYGNSDLAVSNDVAVTQNLISSATLNYTGNLNGQQVVFYLSVDGGATWEQVTPGVEHVFHSGRNLRWRSELITYNPFATPELTGVTISYTEREELPYTGK